MANTNNHIAIRRMVMMLPTHVIALLNSCSPMSVTAIVKPTLGKTQAYQTSWNLIFLASMKTRATLKNRNPSVYKKL